MRGRRERGDRKHVKNEMRKGQRGEGRGHRGGREISQRAPRRDHARETKSPEGMEGSLGKHKCRWEQRRKGCPAREEVGDTHR
jgi:hypothetical protein